MSDQANEIGAGPPGALARPDWRPGGEFTAGELRLDQQYRVQRLRRHLRFVHGSGIVCGLNVVSAADAANPWSLFLCPGYGIGPCGDEIVVARRFPFDLRDYLWTLPLDPVIRQVWIAVEADEIPNALELVSPCGCGCGEPRYLPSRLADSFRIALYWTTPVINRGVFDFCSGATPPCPACPDACGLIVARVVLPPSRNQLLPNSAIDNVNLQGE
jgi:hypothetical protein